MLRRIILAVVAATAMLVPGVTALADEPPKGDDVDTTSSAKLEAIQIEQLSAAEHASATADFYLDAITTVPFNGSYSDVLLSSGWDKSCGFFACGVTLTYEYTRTIWYGADPWNAYSMQLTNIWTQAGWGASGASCALGFPRTASCTISGSGSKTVTRTGPEWNYLWAISEEFFAGVVDFDDFQELFDLTERAIARICYYPANCQTFEAKDSGR